MTFLILLCVHIGSAAKSYTTSTATSVVLSEKVGLRIGIGVLELACKLLNSYHHGDLRDTPVQAALQEAKRGGPEAISIKALAKKLQRSDVFDLNFRLIARRFPCRSVTAEEKSVVKSAPLSLA